MLRWILLAVSTLLLTACGVAPTVTPTGRPAQPEGLAPTSSDAAAPVAGWGALPLRNARTGEMFTLNDFVGKTVLVHPMAMW
jgi:hypothetical protein